MSSLGQIAELMIFLSKLPGNVAKCTVKLITPYFNDVSIVLFGRRQAAHISTIGSRIRCSQNGQQEFT